MAKKDIRLQGDAELILSDDKLSADIQVVKKQDGKEWGSEDLLDLLKEAGISYGFKEEDLAAQLKIGGEKKEKTVILKAARGDAAVAMLPEEPQYSSLDVPEELAEYIPKKLEASATPEISKTTIEKITRQKTVQKKSPLPFMKDKTETVNYTEEKTSTEKVYVDPTVEEAAYVSEGGLIAGIAPSQQGTPGKDIFGEPIPPKNVVDPAFYHGAHVVKEGNDLRASVTGIVRKGSNWCDVVPFKNHQWKIELSEDKATCMMTFKPGDILIPPPEYDAIKEQIEGLEYPLESIMPEGEITELLQKAVDSGEEISYQPISDSQDAHFEILVDEEKLKAVLNVRKGRGKGRPLILKELGSEINKGGLVIADKAKLKEDILAYYNSAELELRDYLLSEGTPAKEGPEQPVDWSVRFLEQDEFKALRKEIDDDRERLEQNDDGSIFPIDSIDELAYVEAEQRVVSFGRAETGEPGKDVFGSAIPGIPGKSVEFKLGSALELKDNMVISGRSGLLERAIVDDVIHLRVRPRRDSRISVEISDDRMEAWLSIDPGEGSGAVLNEKKIRDGIEAEGVIKGLNEEVLNQAIKQALDGNRVEKLKLAEGLAPETGGREEIEFLLQLAGNEKVSIRADGSADFKSRNNMTRVTKDQAIARITPPPAEPVPGFDVTGKELIPGEDQSLNLEISPKIRQEEQEDKTIILYSGIDGELKFENNSLDILEVHTIQGNVGLETGNIKFPGTVQVAGNVESGFYIMSNEDIKIVGGVDRALLSAGGDILIQGGVKGGGKSLLRSKQNIQAAFLEQCTALSVKDMKIAKTCFRSNVKCNGTLHMADKSTIMGGVIKVKNGLRVSNLGSERGVSTTVHFGQDYLVEDQVHVQEKEIKKIQLQIAETDAAIQKASQSKDRSTLTSLANKKTKLLKLMDFRNIKLFNLKDRFEQHFDSQLEVNGTLHAGVLLESHGREMEVSSPQKNVRISFDTEHGRIKIDPLKSE